MPTFRVNGMLIHMKLGGRRDRRLKPCCGWIDSPDLPGLRERCLAISTILCDFPTEDGGTCDAPLCAGCAKEVGPDRHYCPIHAKREGD